MKKIDKKMTIIFFIVGVTLLLIIGTQYYAYKTNYHSALNSMKIYKKFYFPFAFLFWMKKYYINTPNLINRTIIIITVFTLLYSFIIYVVTTKKFVADSHGSSKFSDDTELKKIKVLDVNTPIKRRYKHGVILGKTVSKKTIIDDHPTHVLVIAPTRSGKGVGIILPTLVNWIGSTICFDIKGENFKKTSKFRKDKLKNRVLRLSPCDENQSTKYNPLDEIRIRTGTEIKDTDVISNILVAEKGEQKDHFMLSATTVLTTVILHILYTKEGASLGDVYDFLTDPTTGTTENKFKKIIQSKYRKYTNEINKLYSTNEKIYNDGTHPIIAQGATEILNKSDRERGAVISTTLNRLLLFKDPIVRKNTASSDFKLADILDDKNPISLYFCAEMEDMERLGVFIRIFLTQFMNISMRKENHLHKCLMLLDEFPLYGRLDTIESALGVIASYGIKIMLIAQNKEQIEVVYGAVNTVKQGCASTVFYAPNPTDFDTCQLISDILGNKTLAYNTSSEGRFTGLLDGTISKQLMARKLLEPDEVRTVLGDDKTIIFLTGANPIMGIKIKYYKEKYYKNKIIGNGADQNSNNWAKID